VPPSITFFARIAKDEDGRFHWKGGGAPGSIVDRRAGMNVIIAISNCAHSLTPGSLSLSETPLPTSSRITAASIPST
jgi:uncharacterized protein YcgI (DUF1989 family)